MQTVQFHTERKLSLNTFDKSSTKELRPSWKQIILKHRHVFPLENLRKIFRDKEKEELKKIYQNDINKMINSDQLVSPTFRPKPAKQAQSADSSHAAGAHVSENERKNLEQHYKKSHNLYYQMNEIMLAEKDKLGVEIENLQQYLEHRALPPQNKPQKL